MQTIIQARYSSKRLPGKVLLDLENKPMLQWTIDRLSKSKCITKIIVATSSELSDNPIEEFCKK